MKDRSLSKMISLIVMVLFLIGFAVLQISQRLFGEAYLQIHNNRLHVLVAETPPELYRGLGKRDSLGEYQGMVLVFGKSGRHGIVMRDMRFPLDIIWIQNGEVVDIAHEVQVEHNSDGSLTPYFPREDANAVLEMRAGDAMRYGLKIGDRVEVVEE